MRVAIVVEQLLGPTPGGTGRFTRELAAALVGTRRGDDVLTGWTARHRDLDPAAIDGLAGPRALALPAPVLARVWPHGLGPGPRDADVVLAPTVLAPPRRRRGAALVVAVHDAVPWTAPETQTPHSVRFHRTMIGRLARDADAVVVPTQAVARELPRHVPGLAADRVHVVGEGASDAVTVLPADSDARARRLGLPARYLLMVGTFEPRKGIDTAIAALAAPALPDLPLLLVGQSGWGGVDPEALARDAGVPPGRVHVLGRLEDADLAVAYAGAAALLVPSRDEGFGLPVVEAMAHGTPVVVTDVPALVETAGGAADVVPVGDAAALAAAAAVAVDPTRRAERADAARTVAARHRWPAAAERLWTVLRSVATTTSHD